MSSMQVLIYSNREDVSEVLESEIKEFTGFKPVIQHSFDEFRSMFDLLGKVDLIIIDSPREDIFSFKIIPFIEQRLENVKNIIVLTDEYVMLKKSSVFTYDKFELMMENVKIFLGSQIEFVEYSSVPIDTMAHFKVLPFDVFIKISRDKFVKRINACEEIDSSLLKSLRSKGIYELYFDKKYNKDFSRLLLNNMMNDVEKDYGTHEEKLKVKNDVFLTTKDIVLNLGLAPRVISLCESVMNSIVNDVATNQNEFGLYLKNLKNSNLNFHYRYIELTCFISSQIIEHYETFASSDFTKRVIFAAFFCDVTLKRPEWIHIRNDEQLAALPESVAAEISMHALKASELVGQYQNAPMGTQRIIRHHHGTLNGVGFSGAYYDKLCPLTKCLITSQELAYTILTHPEDNARAIVAEMVHKYKGTGLEEMFELFESKCRPYFAACKIA